MARHFLAVHAKRNRKEINSIAPDLAECLLEFPFPGNVRELENIIASTVLLERGKILNLSSVRHLPTFSEAAYHQNYELLTLAEMEKQHIQRALDATGGNRVRVAKILGINTTTVYRKIEKYKIS